jgi:hypothetical protein
MASQQSPLPLAATGPDRRHLSFGQNPAGCSLQLQTDDMGLVLTPRHHSLRSACSASLPEHHRDPRTGSASNKKAPLGAGLSCCLKISWD